MHRITVRLSIINAYADGTEVLTTVTAKVPPPPPQDDADAYEDWAGDFLFPHTGTDNRAGFGYTVTIALSSDPSLVGRTFEFGY